MNNIVKEFKEFLMRGNLVELAVAFIMGTEFNKIVNSLVNDIVMPMIAMVGGKPDFNSIMLGSIKIGSFITNVLSFVIVAAVVFMMVKAFNKMTKGGADMTKTK